MGSFQQISIGFVCLVAAFAFGHYVNTHPSGEHPADLADGGDQVANDQIGNVQSRLTSGIELIEKQPAPISTMRNRIHPLFSMPQADSKAAVASNSLPPPNQLDGNHEDRRPPGSDPLSNIDSNIAPTIAGSQIPTPSLNLLGENQVTPRSAKASDVPDFSSIMNEMEGTPIALKPLGNMPRHSTPIKNRTAQAIERPRNATANASLKDLAGEFKMATAPNETTAINPWNTQNRPTFSADDFAARLKEGVSTQAPTAEASQRVEANSPPNDPANPQSPASQSVYYPEQSNHVVSREPIPPELLDSPGNSDSPIRLAPLRPADNEQLRVAEVPSQDQFVANDSSNIRDRSVLNSRLEQAASGNTVVSKLPFALDEQGKQQLAAIRSRAHSQLALNTTKFVDHVVQPGETLQSISKRYFGSPDYYLDIYLANRTKLRNPVTIESGIAIRIPVYE